MRQYLPKELPHGRFRQQTRSISGTKRPYQYQFRRWEVNLIVGAPARSCASPGNGNSPEDWLAQSTGCLVGNVVDRINDPCRKSAMLLESWIMTAIVFAASHSRMIAEFIAEHPLHAIPANRMFTSGRIFDGLNDVPIAPAESES